MFLVYVYSVNCLKIRNTIKRCINFLWIRNFFKLIWEHDVNVKPIRAIYKTIHFFIIKSDRRSTGARLFQSAIFHDIVIRIFNFIFSDCGSSGDDECIESDFIEYATWFYIHFWILCPLLSIILQWRERRGWGSSVSWEEFFRTRIGVSLKYSK